MKVQLSPKEQQNFKQKALAWGQAKSEYCCCLDSNNYKDDAYGSYAFLLAVGAERQLELRKAKGAFEALRTFAQENKDWLFGYLSYELKDAVEDLSSENIATQNFPLLHFFSPTYLFLLQENGVLEIESKEAPVEQIWEEIQVQLLPTTAWEEIDLTPRMSKTAYLEAVEAIQEHIVAGDVYELNFCQEFFAEECRLSPSTAFRRLNAIAQTPFAAYYQRQEQYLLCGSPERFLCKRGQQLTAQPIKGTIHRGQTAKEDQALRQQLRASKKDQAENVMIVDLMRNDLTKVCTTGTINVEELFGVYSFERVSQMISTVTGILQPQRHWTEALKATFPIGSMTGAPKVSSLQLIEHYETTTRGLYAGTVGYVTPTGNFDFNVVIRSLLYDAKREYLSCQVGGAIVYDSEPKAEYEECLLKAQTVLAALGGQLQAPIASPNDDVLF
ncbi:MAG: anthranilate synthase component I family protein [Aureispira sp.]